MFEHTNFNKYPPSKGDRLGASRLEVLSRALPTNWSKLRTPAAGSCQLTWTSACTVLATQTLCSHPLQAGASKPETSNTNPEGDT